MTDSENPNSPTYDENVPWSPVDGAWALRVRELTDAGTPFEQAINVAMNEILEGKNEHLRRLAEDPDNQQLRHELRQHL